VRLQKREQRARNNGLNGSRLIYDLYIDRAMIEAEFDALWAKQAALNPTDFNEQARADLRDCLLHQRALRPVKPGRCTLCPDEPRAPLALPSQQHFRIYQEVNNLCILQEGQQPEPLTKNQRDQIVSMLERPQRDKKTAHKVSFDQIRSALHLGGSIKFNLEDIKRNSLKGNSTSASLSKQEFFGPIWFEWSERQQNAIVRQLIEQQSKPRLISRLVKYCNIDTDRADRIADAGLPEGYGALSKKALVLVLPKLRQSVISYAEAAKEAGFHHSRLSENTDVPGRTHPIEVLSKDTGEIKIFHVFNDLPYYGEFLQRHVGFADPDAKPDDLPEKRFGRIANPTVHIGLNQVRKVVNRLIKRYGHPTEVIVEVANELKRPSDHRSEEFRKGPITAQKMHPYCGCAGCTHVRQALMQEENKELRREAAQILQCSEEQVSGYQILKLRLRKEMALHGIAACPYSGTPISPRTALSSEIEIDHILPYSRTLDDGRANKTLCLRLANRIKGERTPYQAKDLFAQQGWDYIDIERRISKWDSKKRFRFGEHAMKEWLHEHKDFLARALNDTRYLSRLAREYLSLICPQDTRVIPGQMTSLLASKFGLYSILHPTGENKKHREDHRHHAVDACVVAVTDHRMLQRFAEASSSTREHGLERLIADTPMPWGNNEDKIFWKSVKRAIDNIWVSHKPDHGHQGQMHKDTAYRPPHLDPNGRWRTRGIGGSKPDDRDGNSTAILPVKSPDKLIRHARDSNGYPMPYKGYDTQSNYCFEIVKGEKGQWEGEIVKTYDAYQLEQKKQLAQLQHPTRSLSGRPLVMRLLKGDVVRLKVEGVRRTMLIAYMQGNGQIFMSDLHEANVDARNRDKASTFSYLSKYAGSLQKAKARRVTISPIGELHDPGFKE